MNRWAPGDRVAYEPFPGARIETGTVLRLNPAGQPFVRFDGEEGAKLVTASILTAAQA